MTLDNKLKSEMASSATYSEQGRTAPIPEYTTSRPLCEPYTRSSFGEYEKIAPNANPIPQPTTSEGLHDTTESLLKAIEKQLKFLNQNVANLEQEVSACKNPDYRVVLSEINSVKCSVEKMLASVNDTQADRGAGGISAQMTEMKELIVQMTDKLARNDRQLAQTLRENANFQIQVRQGMQKDIDAFREQQSGEQFNPILKEIASMYVEYQSLLQDKSISDLSRKNLKALFEQLEELLTDYNAEIIRSEIGSVRQTRSTKIIGKVSTADKDKHNTIAMSRKPGVIRGRTVLYHEFVDVFVYEPTLIANAAAGVSTDDTKEKEDAVFEDNKNKIEEIENGMVDSSEDATAETSEASTTETSENTKY